VKENQTMKSLNQFTFYLNESEINENAAEYRHHGIKYVDKS